MTGVRLAVAACLSLATGCGAQTPEPEAALPDIVELWIRPPAPVVAVGRRIQLVAEAKTLEGFSYDQNAIVTWSVDDPGVLEVNPMGIARGLGAGDTVVRASHPDGPEASVQIAVLASDVDIVRIEPQEPLLPLGESLRLTATAALVDGSLEDVTARASWACNNLAAASVDDANDKGLVTAIEPGRATIAATFLGIRGSTSVFVGVAEGQ